jgi:fructose/tagatose bisphosphate aldolase
MVDLVQHLKKLEGISYGYKMNIDTDLQFAFTEGIRDYMVKNIEYLKLKLETQKVPMFLIKTLRSKKMV